MHMICVALCFVVVRIDRFYQYSLGLFDLHWGDDIITWTIFKNMNNILNNSLKADKYHELLS